MPGAEILEQVKNYLLEAGASRAVVIDTKIIDMLDEPGCGSCPELGRNISRKPTIPPLEVLHRELEIYRQAVLFQARVPVNPDNRDDAFRGANQVHSIVLDAEKFCQRRGAGVRGIIATCCRLCRPCAGVGNPCSYPDRIRSGMGAFGINVVKTCSRVGWPLEFPMRDHVDWTGLVLVQAGGESRPVG